MNFMRVIIVDSLSLEVSQKTSPAIDLLLDARPPGTSRAQQSCFQTELLAILMEHLLAADVLIGDGAALPVVPGGSVTVCLSSLLLYFLGPLRRTFDPVNRISNHFQQLNIFWDVQST